MEFWQRHREKLIPALVAVAVVIIAALTAYAMIGCSVKAVKPTVTDDNYYRESTKVANQKTQSGYHSPSDISIKGTYAYVSDATANKVYKLNLVGTASVKETVDFDAPVNGVFASETSSSVYALVGGLDGRVVKLGTTTDGLAIVKTVNAGHTPAAMVENGEYLYVANRFDDTLIVYKTSDLSVVATLDLYNNEIGSLREPNALTIAQGKLYIAGHLPAGAASANVVSSSVAVVDLTTNKLERVIELPNGMSSVKGIATSGDGNYVYVSGLLARYTYPTTQLDRGWINTNGFTIIDARNGKVLTALMIDDVTLGAANPWDITVVETFAEEVKKPKIVVAVSGLSQLMVIDENGMFDAIGEYAAKIEDENDKVRAKYPTRTDEDLFAAGLIKDAYAEMSNDFRVLNGLKERVQLGGTGVRALAVRGDAVYGAEYFSASVAKVSLMKANVNDAYSAAEIKISENEPAADAVRLGEILWYDGSECYQSWESCASCHPDMRADALNWDNMNDGIGNAKQTKSMIYSHRTPPVMVTGARDSAELAVLKGMNFIQFNTMDTTRLNYINEFMKAQSPEQSPYLNRDGSLTASAKKGKDYFDNSCVSCHSGPNYTDLKFHTSPYAAADPYFSGNAANHQDNDKSKPIKKFVTPTLVEIWRSAPYMFDGGFKTLKETVAYWAKLDTKANFSDAQIEDITNYVGSLGNVGEYYGVEQVRFDLEDEEQKINQLLAGSTLATISVRKQIATDKAAVVKFVLLDKDGAQLDEIGVKASLPAGMKVGDVATITTKMKMPKTISAGAYYRIVIEDGAGNALASTYTYRYGN